jgi:hypothetical protein
MAGFPQDFRESFESPITAKRNMVMNKEETSFINELTRSWP